MYEGKLIIGLTGGIGTGKTTVADLLKEHGFHIIDADEIAREVIVKGSPVLDEIVDYFGSDVLNQDGSLNRKAMASIVFQNEAKRKKLEEIIHPRIIERIWEKTKSEKKDVIIIVAPLLIEAGLDEKCDMVIVITASEDICIERVIKRDVSDPEDIRSRIKSQISESERTAKADVVISNDGNLSDLQKQVDSIVSIIKETTYY